jgi:hypothetical protein
MIGAEVMRGGRGGRSMMCTILPVFKKGLQHGVPAEPATATAVTSRGAPP